jgi:hypothetical protein
MTTIALTNPTQTPISTYDAAFVAWFGGAQADIKVDAGGAFIGPAFSGATYYNQALSGDKTVAVRYSTLQADGAVGVGFTNGSGDGYYAYVRHNATGNATLRFYKVLAGVPTNQQSTSKAFAANDFLAIVYTASSGRYEMQTGSSLVTLSNAGCPSSLNDPAIPATYAALYFEQSQAGRAQEFFFSGTPPVSPTGMDFTPGQTSIDLSVDPTADATQFSVEYSSVSQTGPWTVVPFQVSRFFSVGSLTANTQYWWRARVSNGAGAGPYSPVELQGTLNPATGGGGELSYPAVVVSLSPASVNMVLAETRTIAITVTQNSGPLIGYTPAAIAVVPGQVSMSSIAPTNADGQTTVDITSLVAGQIIVNVE